MLTFDNYFYVGTDTLIGKHVLNFMHGVNGVWHGYSGFILCVCVCVCVVLLSIC